MQKIESNQTDRLTLLLSIEKKKSQYKQDRRPILWCWYGLSSVLILIVLSILGAIFISSGIALVSVLLVIVLIGLVICFVMNLGTDLRPSGFRAIARIQQLISLKREIEQLQTQLRLLEGYEYHQHSPQEHYKDQLPQFISRSQRQANGYRRTHYTFQILIILLSLLVTGLTSGLTGLIGVTGIPWIAPVLSLSVSFLTALTTLFRFHDRGFNLQQTADSIELEITACHLRIFDYSDLSDADALHKLAERTERLRDEQRKRQQQLEQASDAKQITK